jgi:hypothetical protein
MTIGFTGHRDRITEDQELQVFIRDRKHREALWIHGGARGFDAQVEEFAQRWGVETLIIRPDFALYNPRFAPLKRNELIVGRCDLLVACYDWRPAGGTKYAIDWAVKRGRKIHYVKCVQPSNPWQVAQQGAFDFSGGGE